jgi:hypothetical protein
MIRPFASYPPLKSPHDQRQILLRQHVLRHHRLRVGDLERYRGSVRETTVGPETLPRVFMGRTLFFDPLEGFVLRIGEFTGVIEVSTNMLVQP